MFGQERANLLVLETLREQGCEVLAVVEDHPSFRTMPDALDGIGIPYREVPYIGRRFPGYLMDFIIGNPVRYFRAIGMLRRHIREFRPTHIHVPNPFAFLLAAGSAPRNLPMVYRIGDKPRVDHPIWYQLWRLICKRVDHFVADSEFIAQSLRQLTVPDEKISVVYSRAPTRHIAAHPAEGEGNAQQIAFIGQITLGKGIDRLIKAMRPIVLDYPNVCLKIAGPVPDSESDKFAITLKEIVSSDPELQSRVSFLGHVEDIFQLLASSGFIAIPSVADEPFGLVCVEAKTAGRPAVIFPSGGLREQITHGEDGFICRDTSIDALTEGLLYYLSDPVRTREHGKSALASLDRLGVNTFPERWLEIYNTTIPRETLEASRRAKASVDILPVKNAHRSK